MVVGCSDLDDGECGKEQALSHGGMVRKDNDGCKLTCEQHHDQIVPDLVLHDRTQTF